MDPGYGCEPLPLVHRQSQAMEISNGHPEGRTGSYSAEILELRSAQNNVVIDFAAVITVVIYSVVLQQRIFF